MSEIESAQQVCNISIDYSQVGGKPVLPFLIALDLQASDLEPTPGNNQRFCYKITGIGEDKCNSADLSHFVLGICDKITEEEIKNISVTIDGDEQDVIFGDNVELRSASNPDPPTGCPGLKFDFGLDKVEGEMTFCFELTTSYPIGSTQVCLFGGGRTAKGLSICGPVCGETVQPCKTVVYQPVSVCVPVTIKPYANKLPTTTFCCGGPIITPGINTCDGVENGSCDFTITQQICVSVPIEFGATPVVGNSFIQCGPVLSDGTCPDCGSDNDAAKAPKDNSKKKSKLF